MKKVLISLQVLLITCLFCACSNKEKGDTVTSPDGRIRITFNLENGTPSYSVRKGAHKLIDTSLLGFALNNTNNLDRDFEVKHISHNSFEETWKQPWGEEVEVRNHYKEMKVELQERSGDRRLLSIIFRAFNDGIGFRYEFPQQDNLKEFEITAELTEFNVAFDYQTWSIPAYKGEYYEILYQKSAISELDTVCTPLTIETGDGEYITIHEANLTDYAAMNLYPANGSKLKTDLTPWSNGIKVYANAPFVTPWRTIIMVDDLNALANSRIMLNLNEPCKIEDTSWIQPAKYIGIWWGMHMENFTWGQGPKHGATTENAKRYIDFAAQHNIKGVLIEGWNLGWDGDWSANGDKFSFTKAYPDFNIEEITRYGASKGVQLVGHHETGGATINYENQLDSAFAFYKRHGVSVVKTGYVNNLLDEKERHSSQYGVRHYRKVIETAARYQIMIDNHEPVMPTGLQRTWPNLMTHEGVRGQEYDAWSQDGGNPPEHTCIIPFTRGLAGPMDFTPGIFKFENPVFPQTRVQTTVAKQLALYIVIYSPLQMASDLPENYENNPVFQFIEEVPVDWSETVIVDGNIGDYVVTARKDKYSNDWYLGAITDDIFRTLQVDFSFLDKGHTYKAVIYRDGEDADWNTNPYPVIIEEQEITSDTVIELYLAPGGGAAIQLKY